MVMVIVCRSFPHSIKLLVRILFHDDSSEICIIQKSYLCSIVTHTNANLSAYNLFGFQKFSLDFFIKQIYMRILKCTFSSNIVFVPPFFPIFVEI